MTQISSITYFAADPDLAAPSLRFRFAGDAFTGLATTALLSVTDATGDLTPSPQGTPGSDGSFIVVLGRIRSGAISWSLANPTVLLFQNGSSLSAPFSGTNQTPIVELIEQSLVAVLAAITIANSWQINLQVERSQPGGNVIADLKAVVSRGSLHEITDDERDKPGMEIPLMHDGYLQVFNIEVTRAQSALDTDAALALADAEIRKAIKQNWTFGGRVQNIFWKPTLPIAIEDVPANLMQFDAFFFTLLDNPYAQ